MGRIQIVTRQRASVAQDSYDQDSRILPNRKLIESAHIQNTEGRDTRHGNAPPTSSTEIDYGLSTIDANEDIMNTVGMADEAMSDSCPQLVFAGDVNEVTEEVEPDCRTYMNDGTERHNQVLEKDRSSALEPVPGVMGSVNVKSQPRSSPIWSASQTPPALQSTGMESSRLMASERLSKTNLSLEVQVEGNFEAGLEPLRGCETASALFELLANWRGAPVEMIAVTSVKRITRRTRNNETAQELWIEVLEELLAEDECDKYKMEAEIRR